MSQLNTKRVVLTTTTTTTSVTTSTTTTSTSIAYAPAVLVLSTFKSRNGINLRFHRVVTSSSFTLFKVPHPNWFPKTVSCWLHLHWMMIKKCTIHVAWRMKTLTTFLVVSERLDKFCSWHWTVALTLLARCHLKPWARVLVAHLAVTLFCVSTRIVFVDMLQRQREVSGRICHCQPTSTNQFQSPLHQVVAVVPSISVWPLSNYKSHRHLACRGLKNATE